MTTSYRQLDPLSKKGIETYSGKDMAFFELRVEDRVEGSTNDLVKKAAKEGKKEGFALIAGAQSAGRGRAGRSFFSPEGTGVYLSLLLRPEGILAEKPVMITTMAAAAAAEAVEEISGREAKIKWVNDIYLEERKISGILTEASFDPATGAPEYAVLGIGFNVYEPEGGFPEEIRDRAGYIFRKREEGMRNRLSGAFLTRFLSYYRAEDPSSYVKEYQKRSLVTGKKITVLMPDGKGTDASKLTGRAAEALFVDEECRLVVRYEDGETEALSSGEISIRL